MEVISDVLYDNNDTNSRRLSQLIDFGTNAFYEIKYLFGLDSSNETTSWEENFKEYLSSRHYVIFIALIITLMLMCWEKRKYCCPECLKGHFAMIIPVNFLESKENRTAVISSFVLITLDVLEVVQGDNILPKTTILKILIQIVMVLWASFMCLPLLVCFTANTYLSLVLGILYAILYVLVLFFERLSYFDPKEKENLGNYMNMCFKEITILLCGVFILFGYMKTIYHKYRRSSFSSEKITLYQKTYMKNLLIGKLRQSKTDNRLKDKVKNICKKHIYHNVPGFRYSLSILISIVVGLTVVLDLFSWYLGLVIDSYSFILTSMDALSEWKDVPMPNIMQQVTKFLFKKGEVTKWEVNVYDFIGEQVQIIFGCFIAAIVTAYFIAIASALHMLKSYRINYLSIQRQSRNEHLLKSTQDPVSHVVSAIQYSGYQVAYILWGVHFQLFCVTLAFLIFSELVVLPFKYSFVSVLLDVLNKIYPYILLLILVTGIQRLSVKYFFLQEKGKVLALDNRKGFYMMMYFTFFYNIFKGFFSCLIRMVKTVVFGVWFLSRIDRSIFPRTFERFDAGFKSYSCLVKLEALQTNCVAVSFCKLLLRKLCRNNREDILFRSKVKDISFSKNIDCKRKKSQMVARNRWFVFYTLMRNPTLIPNRGIQIFQKKIEMPDEDVKKPEKYIHPKKEIKMLDNDLYPENMYKNCKQRYSRYVY